MDHINARYIRIMGRAVACVLCLCMALLSGAQDGSADRAALVRHSAALRMRMIADSMPMTAVQVDTLMAMAARSPGPAADRMLQQALVISDSIKDLPRERAVLAALGIAYGHGGRADEALQAVRAAHFLGDSLMAVAHAKALGELREQQEAADRQWETEKAAQGKELQAQRDELTRLRQRLQVAYGVSGALAVFLIVVMGRSLFRTGRGRRKVNGPVAARPAVPAEPRRRNTLRAALPTGDAAREGAITDTGRTIDAEDAVLLALFRKRLPERLKALKEARAQGDPEKVLRVVASLRPQLVHHDADRFAQRCARLAAAGPAVLEEASRSDLNGLVADLERVLGAPFSEK